MNTRAAITLAVGLLLLGCPKPKGDVTDGAADAPAATTAAPTAEAPPDAGLAAPVDTAKPVLRVATKDGGQDAAAAASDAGAVATTDAGAPTPTTEDAGAPAPSGDAGGGAGRVLPKCPPGQVRNINGRCLPAR